MGGTIIMKFLLLAAALASVHAEADPAFTYATGYHLPYAIGAPLAYTTHAIAPVVYTAAAGCQNDAGAVVPCAHGGLVGVVPAAPVAAAEPAVRWLRTPLRWVLRLRLPPCSLCLPRRLPQLSWRTCPLRWKIRGRGAINERSK